MRITGNFSYHVCTSGTSGMLEPLWRIGYERMPAARRENLPKAIEFSIFIRRGFAGQAESGNHGRQTPDLIGIHKNKMI